ncbi:MAG: ISAzo13 family transposase, partial [Desulfobulbaceae bacterium]|nr:ISAzo13 family transposase [Desulfobulbaceae bacterium]
PATGDNHIWFSTSKVTADFMVDRIGEMIPIWKKRFGLHTLVTNADNGPESSGRRTQWLKRLVDLADRHELTIRLTYYPPYHSKYNPIERVWGVLENHWRGEILDTVNKALGLARTMTYRGIKPTVRKIIRNYRTGKSLPKKIMKKVEKRLDRKPGLENWFITIAPHAQNG